MERSGSAVSSIGTLKRRAGPIANGFEDEMVKLLPRLRRFAAGLARDRVDGDDLVQLTVERALTSRAQWQEGTRLDSWMYRIMRNIWIDEGRSRTRRAQTFIGEEAGLAIGRDGGQEAVAELGTIGRAMQQLPDEQREAVMLVLVEGYRYAEAADIVGCPVGTLTSRLGRGREALMAMLGEAA
jgi:RNA polymerase sigma factor (sigma-70 family)